MPHFENAGLKGGLWRGRLRGNWQPGRLLLTYQGVMVAEARLTPDGDQAWQVEVNLPADVLSDGVQTLVLTTDSGPEGSPALAGGGETVARLPLMAGRPLDEDLLAELAALRAELELVKRELRRMGAAQRQG
ncbi:MAG: hypothetical protein ACK41U_14180 [Paracoccus sp. (in: a-proteobacteria)]|uniref:hypothetical protein n=1 Tax=Paracoccus sp. TaxID=267 RepID=UPI00391D3BD8